MLSREELKNLCMTHPDRAADEVLRLREALRNVGEASLAAKKIADEALALSPQVDKFPGSNG